MGADYVRNILREAVAGMAASEYPLQGRLANAFANLRRLRSDDDFPLTAFRAYRLTPGAAWDGGAAKQGVDTDMRQEWCAIREEADVTKYGEFFQKMPLEKAEDLITRIAALCDRFTAHAAVAAWLQDATKHDAEQE
jgi:hypothetical protein